MMGDEQTELNEALEIIELELETFAPTNADEANALCRRKEDFARIKRFVLTYKERGR